MPYILSSTLRRMSNVSTLSSASSGLSSGSASSDGPSCISSQELVPPHQPTFPSHPFWNRHYLSDTNWLLIFTHSSLLSHPSDRRASVLSRPEDDNRIARKNRKEWSVSKSQVIAERQSDAEEVWPNVNCLFLFVHEFCLGSDPQKAFLCTHSIALILQS